MLAILSILIILVCVLLTLVVLVQNSKGGGLAANFSSQNQIMGVRKTTDFLEKATWTLAAALLVFSLLSVFALPNAKTAEAEEVKTNLSTEGMAMPNNLINQNTAEPIAEPAGE